MVRRLWRRENTRFHPELGRENLQRRWYFVLRHGRVGRCRALKSQLSFDAGWSSLVARQAHNLKVAGSNPAPATNRSVYISFLMKIFTLYNSPLSSKNADFIFFEEVVRPLIKFRISLPVYFLFRKILP